MAVLNVPLVPYPGLGRNPPPIDSFVDKVAVYRELQRVYNTLHYLNSKIEALATAVGDTFPPENVQ